MDDLKKIMTEYEAEPSAGSWEKLSQRLDAVMPVGEASSAAQTTSGAKGLLASTTAKITAAVVGTAVVATTVIATIVGTHHNEPANIDNPSATTTAATIDTVVTEEFNAPAEHPETTVNYSTEVPAVQTSVPATPTAPEKTVAPTNTSPTTPAPEPKSAKSSTNTSSSPNAITRPSVPARTNISRPAIPANSTIVQNIQKDPVVQSKMDENFTWSQPEKIEIPNIFTPNGDGFNDNFHIKGLESCSKRQLIIRDRNGKIVYKTNLYENNWNGGDCPDGAYHYQFVFNNGDIDQTVSGTVTILRK